MKRSTQILFILFILSILPFYLNASPLDEVHRSRHNLAAPSLPASTSCIVCHTDSVPWRSSTPTKGAPDPEDSKPKGESSFPLWVSKEAKPYSINATLPRHRHPYNQPTGSSLTCLACHDGALGENMHGVNVDRPRLGAEATLPWEGSFSQREAPPLSRVDHPVSVPYPRKPNGMFVPENPTVTLSRYWAIPDRQGEGFVLPATGFSSYLDLPEERVSSPEILSNLVRTTGGIVQCDSCHNPHSEKIRPFLRVPSATLCLVCHDR